MNILANERCGVRHQLARQFIIHHHHFASAFYVDIVDKSAHQHLPFIDDGFVRINARQLAFKIVGTLRHVKTLLRHLGAHVFNMIAEALVGGIHVAGVKFYRAVFLQSVIRHRGPAPRPSSCQEIGPSYASWH